MIAPHSAQMTRTPVRVVRAGLLTTGAIVQIAKMFRPFACGSGGMADALDLGSSRATCAGSSPAFRTRTDKKNRARPGRARSGFPRFPGRLLVLALGRGLVRGGVEEDRPLGFAAHHDQADRLARL